MARVQFRDSLRNSGTGYSGRLRALAAEFPGFEQVLLAGLAGATDRAVWAYAAARGLAVVSNDADFRNRAAADPARRGGL